MTRKARAAAPAGSRRDSFGILPLAAITSPDLSNADLRLLALLSVHRDYNTGWCWPRPALLAAELHMTGKHSSDTIADMIRRLAAGGWIEYRPGRGKRASLYRVNLDRAEPTPGTLAEVDPPTFGADAEDPLSLDDAEDFPISMPETAKGGYSPPPKGGYSPPLEGGVQPPLVYNETHNETHNETQPMAIASQSPPEPGPKVKPARGAKAGPEAFRRWYAVYPRRVAPGLAMAAYAKAVAKVGEAQLLELTQAYADAVARSGWPMDKIPHPTTWLNQERWGDSPEHTFGDGAPDPRRNGAGSRNGARNSAFAMIKELSGVTKR